MSKYKVKFICSQCGYESLKWIGKCPQCHNWNSFIEEIIENSKTKHSTIVLKSKVEKITEINSSISKRMKTNIEEFDRVLGGGLIPGSVVLIGGDPGIGKSTLVIQAASKLNRKVLYVSGEESIEQISMRADRLKTKTENIFVLPETELNSIFAVIEEERPDVVIIDSIQTIHNHDYDNSAGTVTQIRECTSLIMENAKKNNYAAIIVGHVTKEGIIAGPKLLEHIVDTVIQFEGESNRSYRILRAIKNRFGSTNEIGIFNMEEQGLIEVKNPSELFIGDRDKKISGSVITSSIEGTRPVLIEIQALVTPSNFGNPQRVTTGFDARRLSILLAVLERRAGFKVSTTNVFLNVTGGLRIFEPAVDLAVCCAIASSLSDKISDINTVVIGEVGLGGEIRNVGFIEKRINEAIKLGFTRAIIPEKNNKELKQIPSFQIIAIETLSEAIHLLLR